MGNFSSCSSRFSDLPRSPIPPSLVAKVLLIDGSVLHFTHPIKVIRLLLDYPHHFICPLDSLRPGHHSLSSLLPDEELQLGHLYLLLPFQTFQGHRSSPFSGIPLPGRSASPVLDAISDYLPGAAAAVAKTGERARLLIRNSSDVCYSGSKVKDKRPSHLEYSNSVKENVSDSFSSSNRLCDTPELQRAYRSAMLRRCRTWTPRLQAIKEGRRGRASDF